MRTSNSIKNVITAMISSVLNILFGFITQKIFLNQLGLEALGINSLFNSIISMMAIAELGFGISILYNLYKPIANNDKEQIKSLMNFYKKSYNVISIIILIIGICMLPFLKSIVGDINISININLIFMLYIIECIASYLLSYKRSLLYANQKNYIVDLVHIGYIILMNVMQIFLLYLTKSFILYLTIKIICRIIENIIISIIVNKKYSFIKEKNVKDIEKNILADIIKKVKSLLLHRIGGIIVMGSDSIIITKFLGVEQNGIYSNYNVVTTALSNVLTQILNGVTASIGNMLVTESKEKTYSIYKKISFLNFFIYSIATIGIYNCIQPLIEIWIGKDFLINNFALMAICINFYLQGQRNTINIFKNAAGIFYEDRHIPLIEAGVNLIASIILAKLCGLAGVFVGTIISVSVLFFYSYPKYVYNALFKESRQEYILEVLKYFIIMIISGSIVTIIIKNIIINNVYLQLFFNGIICILLILIIYGLLFNKKSEFVYYKKMIINLLKYKNKN